MKKLWLKKQIYVLVACEESQLVTTVFRKMGIKAYSCDLLPTSGRHPEWHIQVDLEDNQLVEFDHQPFFNCDKLILHQNWDAIIAFPPCTHLAVSGARWFKQKRKDGRQQQAIDFFMQFTKLKCPYVAIENPVSIMSTIYRKWDQLIHPYQFGHLEQKATCLWLYGLPPLQETNNVYDEMMKLPYKERAKVHYCSPGPERSRLRSRTFPGIAQAMGKQWGRFLLKTLQG